jgi:hypothetical protein
MKKSPFLCGLLKQTAKNRCFLSLKTFCGLPNPENLRPKPKSANMVKSKPQAATWAKYGKQAVFCFSANGYTSPHATREKISGTAAPSLPSLAALFVFIQRHGGFFAVNGRVCDAKPPWPLLTQRNPFYGLWLPALCRPVGCPQTA